MVPGGEGYPLQRMIRPQDSDLRPVDEAFQPLSYTPLTIRRPSAAEVDRIVTVSG